MECRASPGCWHPWHGIQEMKKPLRATLSALLLAACGLMATPAAAAPARSAPPDPMSAAVPKTARLQALLERVKYEQKELKSMEARFVQKQESSMLAAPEESTGVF